jgi:hypothetical protein
MLVQFVGRLTRSRHSTGLSLMLAVFSVGLLRVRLLLIGMSGNRSSGS